MSEFTTEVLTLTPDTERKALKACWMDLNFSYKWRDRLKAEHFQSAFAKIVFSCIDGYLKKYGRLPSFSDLRLLTHSVSTINISSKDLFAYLKKVSEEDLTNDDMIRAHIMDHMKKEDYKGFLMLVAERIASGKLNEVDGELKKLVLRHSEVTPPSEYQEKTVADRVKEESLVGARVSTPWPTFNLNHGGGMESGALSLFMGPSGSGKTIILCNVAAHFVKQKMDVLYMTFELDEAKVQARLDVILTGFNHKQRKENPGLLDNAIKNFERSGIMGKLYVKQLPTGTCRPNDILGVIEEHRMRNGKPYDVVVIDYLTIMTPNNPEHVDMKNDYLKLKKITEEVRAIAMMVKIPIISAIQSNRGSMDKETIKKQDAADSFAIVHVVDLLLTINQSELDKKVGAMRLYVAKARNFKDEYNIICNVNYDNLTIVEDTKYTGAYNDQVTKRKAESVDPSKLKEGEAIPTTPAYDPESANSDVLHILGDLLMPNTKFSLPTIDKPIEPPAPQQR